MKKLLLLFIPMIISGMVAFSQTSGRDCGTMNYLQQQISVDPSISTAMEKLEQWTQNWIAQHPNYDQKTVITVPVVVHIIYANSSQNLSDSRVQEQINVLNTDFSGQNVHSMEAFSTSLKVNTNIQFCLAQQTPSGTATNGIERRSSSTSFVNGSNPNGKERHYSQGGLDAWDVTKYFNLWVCNLGGSLCGYSQFPYAAQGGGVNETYGSSINYMFFGLTGATAPYNLGGTATHEIGHCFNLFHIWGDDGGSCSGTDNCADTPNQANYTYGTHSGALTDNCTTTSPGIMYMDFMDYSDDIDYTNFTPNQNSRIQALFVSGGPLYPLTYSIGCTAPNPGSCGTPSGLGASSITATTATLAWLAVSGATSYNVQYSITGANTWTSASTTSTLLPVTGLLAATSYEFQVQAVCSTGPGSFSSSYIFTTLPTGGCVDNYEANNTRQTAKSIPVNTDISALIGTSTDVDYFKFSNTKTMKNIKVTLTNLPFNYDLKLYKNNGTLLATSQNGGTTSETIIYNNAPVGNYYVHIYGYAGAYSASSCYTLTANISSSTFKPTNAGEVLQVETDELSIYPNPANDQLSVDYNTETESKITISVMDIAGRIILSNDFTATIGLNNYSLDVSIISNGNYIIELNSGDNRTYKKLMIAK